MYYALAALRITAPAPPVVRGLSGALLLVRSHFSGAIVDCVAFITRARGRADRPGAGLADPVPRRIPATRAVVTPRRPRAAQPRPSEHATCRRLRSCGARARAPCSSADRVTQSLLARMQNRMRWGRGMAR